MKQFEQVTYLSDGIISGSTRRSFVSDDYERLRDKKINTNIPISSAYAHPDSPADRPAAERTRWSTL